MAQAMSGERNRVLALVGFTFFVWLGRIRNLITDDTLSGVRFAWSLGVAICFLGLAAAALFSQRNTGALDVNNWARMLAVLSVGYWSVRGVQIALGDHDAAFIVVHSLLASVSVALGALVLASQLRNAGVATPS